MVVPFGSTIQPQKTLCDAAWQQCVSVCESYRFIICSMLMYILIKRWTASFFFILVSCQMNAQNVVNENFTPIFRWNENISQCLFNTKFSLIKKFIGFVPKIFVRFYFSSAHRMNISMNRNFISFQSYLINRLWIAFEMYLWCTLYALWNHKMIISFV